MTRKEVSQFIEIMKAIREDWTPEQVEEKYGDCATLREAIDRRLGKINAFYDYVEEVIKPDAQARGLWPKEPQ